MEYGVSILRPTSPQPDHSKKKVVEMTTPKKIVQMTTPKK